MSKEMLQMELELWRARAQSAQNAGMALQAQATLLQRESQDITGNIERVEAALKALEPTTKPLEAVKA